MVFGLRHNAPGKKPRRIIFVDDLKRLVSGKVPRERLDELIALLKEDSPD